ncbi:hypothetical protein LH128_00897 [Sphingomonas sp. LH128]|uniref:nuclear transport factor 2 family protein n=1 Tax=Sphingomonas sp. LH128 TaxID=473781 RepID=UPI00027CBF0A|nr:nuclear transport factor 2 family protein [Sphingomonas sp. LH128]EJU14982.1 hypothetical protein LH128_00897 [Sphingomonas sp. LH128]
MTTDIEALAAQVRQLHDLEAIRGLIGRYAIGADRQNDPAIMAPLFAEDATWESEGFGRFAGRATIAEALSKTGQEQILWTLHYMISPTIFLDGDQAHGSWYLWELATIAGADGAARSVWVGGTYDARFVRRDGGWYFHALILNVKLATPFDTPWSPDPRTAL